jgi:hypothetical protein
MKLLFKQLQKETRQQLNRFPNPNLEMNLELGAIGNYYSRNNNWVWINNLANIGVAVHSPPNNSAVSESYFTEGAVDINFNVSDGRNTVGFKFNKNHSLVLKSHNQTLCYALIDELEAELNHAIRNGLKWNKDWLVITDVWHAEGYTLLMSGSKGSTTEIKSANGLATKAEFNYANADLLLESGNSSGMAYQVIAQTSVTPYFNVCRLVGDASKGYRLKKYALPFWM